MTDSSPLMLHHWDEAIRHLAGHLTSTFPLVWNYNGIGYKSYSSTTCFRPFSLFPDTVHENCRVSRAKFIK